MSNLIIWLLCILMRREAKTMGKLKGKRIYLGGPVEACGLDLTPAQDWRQQITPKLSRLGLTVLNPLIKPAWMPNIDGKGQCDMRSKLSTGNELKQSEIDNNNITRQWCLNLVRISDILIFNLHGNVKTYGTYEELACSSQKPVFLILDDIHIPSMWIASQLGLYNAWDISFYIHDSPDSILQRLVDVNQEGSEMFKFKNKLKWSFLTEWINNPKGD
jgi:hypothetical protein